MATTTTTHAGGRKPRTGEAADNRITVRFSDDELADLDARRAQGESRSDAIRRLTVGRDAPKTVGKSRGSKKVA